jgi:hypothetical protein
MVVEGRVTRTFANGDNGRPILKVETSDENQNEREGWLRVDKGLVLGERIKAMKTKTNLKAGQPQRHGVWL